MVEEFVLYGAIFEVSLLNQVRIPDGVSNGVRFLFYCLWVKSKQALFKYMGTFIKQRELTDIKNMTEIIVLSEALAAPIGVD